MLEVATKDGTIIKVAKGNIDLKISNFMKITYFQNKIFIRIKVNLTKIKRFCQNRQNKNIIIMGLHTRTECFHINSLTTGIIDCL